MAIEVLWGSGSPYAWRVLLALEFKGLPYESTLLSFSAREHKRPEHLALNPRGKVPVLRDGDTVLSESLAIVAWLDAAYPARPLFGASAAEAGAVWLEVAQLLSYLEAPAGEIYRPIYFDRVDAQRAQIDEALPKVMAELARLDALLADRAWLCGGAAPTAADVFAIPLLESLLRAAGKPLAPTVPLTLLPLVDHLPHLAGYVDRYRALPAFDATYPPHWRG